MKYLNHSWFFLILACLILIVVKIPHLGLPYFLDETYSYIPAIVDMAKVGPSMLPGTIPIILSKGHPLFFYFLASTWMKFIAGDSITLMRLFPLIVSIASLFVFHRFIKRHINITLANVTVLLITVQPLFLAQSSLVLPEIFLFTLFMLCFDSYLSRNYALYALFGSLMMLTKETGAVFILVFGLAYLVENYSLWKTKKFWYNLVLLGIPILVYLIFLFLHYLEFGAFFFSEHLSLISTDPSRILHKLKSATWTIFLAHGRNIIFFTAILAFAILIFRKQEIRYKKFLVFYLSILIVFLIFTSLNFYVYRYVLPVMGISLLALLIVIQQIKLKYVALNIAFIALILSFSAYKSATKLGGDDADLGYVQFLVVHQEMIRYCEEQSWYDKEIGASFNMVMSLRDRYGRYLSTDKNFKSHHLPGIENRDIIIYDSTCWKTDMPESEKSKLTLLKRFQYKKHWGEIYRTNNETDLKTLLIN